MTIQVVSNDAPVEKTEAPKESTSALAPEVEQKPAPESDTEETDAEGEAKDESQDESESDDAEESKDAEKDKPKKKGGFQRRIDKLNARYAAAQSEIEHWKSMALKGADEAKPEKAESKPAPTDGKPNADNFETHAEYVEALTDWKTEQKLKERDQKLEQSKLQTEQEKVLNAHIERVKSFAEKTADFNEVLEAVDEIPVSATVRELIVASENGPELMYELAKSPEEYAKICKLSPLAAAREIGRIESRLTSKASEKKPEPKKLTKAPKPIDPLGAGKGAVSKSLDDPNLSQAEYERIRREQIRKAQAS